METKEYIEGVFCEHCIKYETKDCNVINASPWSKYDYCSHFRDAETNKSLPEIIKELVI